MANVKISLDGDHKTVTDHLGNYKLEHLQGGTYTIEAFLDENTILETLNNVQISPSGTIPDITVKFYAICGKIQILSGFSQQRYVALTEQGGAEQKTVTDSLFKFCFEVKPMKVHTIVPYISAEEKDRGLSFTPPSLEIMVDKPILNADFIQSKVAIEIILQCLSKCRQIEIDILNLQSDQKSKHFTDQNSYLVPDLLPGTYRITIHETQWCWEITKFDIQVYQKKTIAKFKQYGYKVPYSSSHDFAGTLPDNSTIYIQKGTDKHLCLKTNAPQKLLADSCYKFENLENIILSPGSQIDFKANRFLVRGHIVADERAKLSVVEKTQILIQETNELMKINPNVQENQQGFQFSYYAKNGMVLTLVPISDETEQQNLLFYPQSVMVEIQNDCILGEHVFSARPGLIIEGQIIPGVGEVMITVNAEGQLIASSQTDKNGKYKIGPLYDHIEYLLSATKQGYSISQDESNMHNFYARKLSHLQIQIGEELPLSNVFVTCFSADAPSNSKPKRYQGTSNEEGKFEFLDLPQGSYYIKPTLKEYDFTPPQQFIDLPEGQTQLVNFSWQQVAFSVYGRVVKFNKDPVEGVQVLVVNQTDSMTDHLGNFRIRGLQPNTQYTIMPKSDRILHASPMNLTFIMKNKNIEDIEFLVLPRLSTITLTGRVFTEFQDQLYVQIWNQKTLVQEKRLSKTSFFQFTDLKQENYTVVVRSLENLYSRALGKDQRYVEIKIEKKQSIVVDKIKHTQLYGLVFLLVIFLVIFNMNSVIKYFKQF